MSDDKRSEIHAPSHGVSTRAALLIWLVVATGALAVLTLIISAPLLAARGHGFLAATVYRIFQPLCHQIAERSFQIENYPFAVCARCFGLYVGFACAALFYPLARSLRRTDAPARLWLILAALPTAIDFTLGFTGVWANTHLSRFVTAFLFSAVSVFYIIPGLVDCARLIGERRASAGKRPLIMKRA